MVVGISSGCGGGGKRGIGCYLGRERGKRLIWFSEGHGV